MINIDRSIISISFLVFLTITAKDLQAQWKTNDMARPKPPVVQPVENSGAPSDAIILFDGSNLSHWKNKDGSTALWEVKDSYMEATKEWNDIRTVQNFGDCQLHLEFMISTPVKGENNMRGNSGIVFMGRYEVQIMDSYHYETFADGQNAAIYRQYAPLVNASLPPDKWQSFDIIFTGPGFGSEGELVSPAKITMSHNGVLVHHNAVLKGQSSWLGEIKYEKHPEKLPIVLQSHIQPVRFRNIWVRDLEPKIKNPYTHQFVDEITLPLDTLKNYAGEYFWGSPPQPVQVEIKDNYLKANLPGDAKRELFAYDIDRFLTREIDLWFFFTRDEAGKVTGLEMNIGGTIVLFRKK